MNKLRNFLKHNKKTAAIFFAIFGCCLIGISYFQKDTSRENQYIESELEARTRRIIETVAGEGTTTVMITFDEAAKQAEKDTCGISVFSQETQAICSGKSKIAGVMIVCKTLSNANDFSTIKQAVATCLDIPKSKIYIIGGNG